MTELKKSPWPDWETVRLIGRGSFGSVYEIRRKLINEDTEAAALKVIMLPQNPDIVDELRSEGYDGESITATFDSHLKSIVAEYSLMRKMDGSANIVNCKDIRYIQHDDGIGWDIYIRMELLTPLLKALPAATEDIAAQLGRDMCNALVLCEKNDIVHRDIKPQNIFISSNGDYKLGDFGIAKTIEKVGSGTMIGTYKYMAPEVYHCKPYGHTADIYSLGLVLYWLLNERRMPFVPLPPKGMTAEIEEQARVRRFSGEALPAPAHGSKELKQIVLKACAYDPNDRYQTATQMLQDIENVLRAHPISNLDDLDGTIGPESFLLKKLRKQDPIAESIPHPEYDLDKTVGPEAIIPETLRTQEPVSDSVLNPKEDPDGTVGPASFIPGKLRDQDSITEPVPNPENDRDKTVGPESFIPKKLRKQEPITDPVSGPEDNRDKTVGPESFIPKKLRKQEPATEPVPDSKDSLDNKAESNSFVPDTTPQKEKISKKNLLILIGAAAAVVLVLVLALLFRGCDSGSSGNNGYYGDNGYYGNIGNSDSISDSNSTENPETSGNSDSTESISGTVAAQPDWSDWMDALPSNVTEEAYEIEQKTLYSSRRLETTSSTETNTMDGWELFETVEANGKFGPWSDWSDKKVEKSSTREVETQTKYRYRTRETTTGSASTKTGWTLYDTTSSWGSYGNWSSWSTTKVTKSDSRKVEEKTQYRYRDIASSGNYTDWSDWSSWQDEAVSENELRKVETKTFFAYYYYKCPGCKGNIYAGNMKCCYCGTWVPENKTVVWGTMRHSQMGFAPFSHNNNYTYATYKDEVVFRDPAGDQTKKQYRYATREIVPTYGSWSAWSDTVYTQSSTRQVETQKLYRYCDRSEVKTYHFYRWGAWSAWDTKEVSAVKGEREVETLTFYRYREQANATTYYFRRWTQWSDYSESVVTSSETVEVQTKTQYRFKSK